jgi:hypothetical protein
MFMIGYRTFRKLKAIDFMLVLLSSRAFAIQIRDQWKTVEIPHALILTPAFNRS